MTTEPAATSPALTRDIPCITCGYNLRGLSASGACPECATSIAISLSEQSGKVSTTRVIWARCMVVGLIGWVVTALFGVLLWSYAEAGGHSRYPGPQLWSGELTNLYNRGDHPRNSPMGFSGRMWAAGCLMMIYLITSPRTPTLVESAVSLRRIARWYSIVLGGFLIAPRSFTYWGLPADADNFIALGGTVLLYVYLARSAGEMGLGTEARALHATAVIAGVTMALSIWLGYITVMQTPQMFGNPPGAPPVPPVPVQWISTEGGRRVDSICWTIGLIGGVLAAGTMIRIALAILPMASTRHSKGIQQ